MSRNSLAFVAILSLNLFACSDKGGDTAGDDTDVSDSGDSGADSGDSGADTGDTDSGVTDTDSDVALEIAGTYTDNYGGDHVITSTSWAQYGATTNFAFTQYDNDANFAIAQNDAANTYSPNLFSRFDWTVDSSSQLWYCQTAYDAATEADALATAAADATDPATTGCGGFSWTSLTPS